MLSRKEKYSIRKSTLGTYSAHIGTAIKALAVAGSMVFAGVTTTFADEVQADTEPVVATTAVEETPAVETTQATENVEIQNPNNIEVVTQADVDAVVASNEALEVAYVGAVEAHTQSEQSYGAFDQMVRDNGDISVFETETVEHGTEPTVEGYKEYENVVKEVQDKNQKEVEAHIQEVKDRDEIIANNKILEDAHKAEIEKIIVENEEIKKANQAERNRVNEFNNKLEQALIAYEEAVKAEEDRKLAIETANEEEKTRVETLNKEGSEKVKAENEADKAKALEEYNKLLEGWKNSGIVDTEEQAAYDNAYKAYQDKMKSFEGLIIQNGTNRQMKFTNTKDDLTFSENNEVDLIDTIVSGFYNGISIPDNLLQHSKITEVSGGFHNKIDGGRFKELPHYNTKLDVNLLGTIDYNLSGFQGVITEDGDKIIKSVDLTNLQDKISARTAIGKIVSSTNGEISWPEIMTQEEFDKIVGPYGYEQIVLYDGKPVEVTEGDRQSFIGSSEVLKQLDEEGRIKARYAVSLYDGSIYRLSDSNYRSTSFKSPGEGTIQEQIVEKLTDSYGSYDENKELRFNIYRTDDKSDPTQATYTGLNTMTIGQTKETAGFLALNLIGAKGLNEKYNINERLTPEIREKWGQAIGEVSYQYNSGITYKTTTEQIDKFNLEEPQKGEPDPNTKPEYKEPDEKVWEDIKPNLITYEAREIPKPTDKPLVYKGTDLKPVPTDDDLELTDVPTLTKRTLLKVTEPDKPNLDDVPEVTKTTSFIDENGNNILPPVYGTEEPKNIPEYEFVETKVDDKGNTIHIYKQVEKTTPTESVKEETPKQENTVVASTPVKTKAPEVKQETPQPTPANSGTTSEPTKELPSTGVETAVGMFSALIGATTVLGATKIKRKDD